MPEVVVMMGLPGSGKTTRNANVMSFTIEATDQLLLSLPVDEKKKSGADMLREVAGDGGKWHAGRKP